MALLCPLLPTAEFPVLHSATYLLAQRVNNRDIASDSRFVSVFLNCDFIKVAFFIIKICYKMEFTVLSHSCHMVLDSD